MKKILVTGGCGYIGSHTIVDLIQNGFEIISIDNNSRSSTLLLEGIEKITGKKIKNYKVDLCDFNDTHAVFEENDDIAGIIHFAAFKAVGESVQKPLMYFENNLLSLINLLKCVELFRVPHFVFSSSCPGIGLKITKGTRFVNASETVKPPAFVMIKSAALINSSTFFTNPKRTIGFFAPSIKGSRSVYSFLSCPQTTILCTGKEVSERVLQIHFIPPRTPYAPPITRTVGSVGFNPSLFNISC